MAEVTRTDASRYAAEPVLFTDGLPDLDETAG